MSIVLFDPMVGGHHIEYAAYITRYLVRQDNIVKDARVVIAKHQKDFERYPKTYGRALASLAQMELTFDRKCGWKTAWKAVTVYPLQLKVYIALLLSLAGEGTYAKLYSWWKRMRGDQYLGRESCRHE